VKSNLNIAIKNEQGMKAKATVGQKHSNCLLPVLGLSVFPLG
jgi:hypothetical protein